MMRIQDPNFEQRTRDSFAQQPAMAGRTISVVDGQAFQFKPGSTERKLVATMTATVMTVTGRDDVRH